MTIDISITKDSVKAKFASLKTFKDLAELLEVKPGYLNFLLYQFPLEDRYTTFSIPKRKPGNFRTISEPIKSLKILQRKLKQVLECVYEPRCSVHGFTKGSSIVTNARAHRSKRKLKYVLNIDIEDFFPSIHFGRVRGLFHNSPYNLPLNVATWLAQICCHERGLPQGSPTSPIVANMICNRLDSQLQRLAQRNRCTYTRYADDITFSTSMSQFPQSLASRDGGQVILGTELSEIIASNSFNVNHSKIKLQTLGTRQEITGITVNRFPNVKQAYIRQIRAMLHDWETSDSNTALNNHLKRRKKHRYPGKRDLLFSQIVRGKIEYLGMVRGKDDFMYIRFMEQLKKLDNTVDWEKPTSMTGAPAKIFINYARADYETVNGIYQRLRKAKHQPWLDKEDIVGGERWERAISRAIKDSNIFLCVLSDNSFKRTGVLQKEIKIALDIHDGLLDEHIFIIPIRLSDCAIPERVEEFHYLDYSDPEFWEKLEKSIQTSLDRRK